MDIPFSVIILDDHRMMQEGLSSYLESHGCTVVARLASCPGWNHCDSGQTAGHGKRL